MKYLKAIDLGALKITPRTTSEEFEQIALTAKNIHQSLYCGGELLNVLENMYHFKNGRNYYGGKTIENISALQSLVQNSVTQKFDPFNAVPAILLNLQLQGDCSRTELIAQMGTGMVLHREIACEKDLFFLRIMDYLPLHNMFAMMAGESLMTIDDQIDDKLMTTAEIQKLNEELPYFQLVSVGEKLTDQIIVRITANEKLLKSINSKLSKVDVGLIYGQYAGVNIARLRSRLLSVA